MAEEKKENVVEFKPNVQEGSVQDIAQKAQEEVDAYKEEIDKINTQEELDAKEKEIMAKMEENDTYINGVKYKLPKDVVFDGQKFTKASIGKLIGDYIADNEQSWQYILGLYGLAKIWNNLDQREEISYSELDNTLRILGGMKFKGMAAYRNVLAIIEYIKPMEDAYKIDCIRIYKLAEMHNAIISRRELIDVHPKQDVEDANNL